MQRAIDTMESEIADLEREQAAAPEEPAPEPQPAPEPEPVQQAAVPEQPQPAPVEQDKDRNLARALEEERRARREQDRQLAVLTDRLERIQQAQQQPVQPPAPVEELAEHVKKGKPTVAPEDDMAEYIRQRDEIDEHRFKVLNDDVQQRKQQTESQQRYQQLMTAIQGHEYQFLQQQPDYYDAVRHLRQDRLAELMETGMPHEVAMQQLNQDELYMASMSLRNHKSPAEAVYALAKRRGYQAPSASPAPTGATPAPAAPASAPPAPPPMDRLAAGAAEAMTLGAAGSGASAGKLSPGALVNMTEADFADWLRKSTKAEQQAMMGA